LGNSAAYFSCLDAQAGTENPAGLRPTGFCAELERSVPHQEYLAGNMLLQLWTGNRCWWWGFRNRRRRHGIARLGAETAADDSTVVEDGIQGYQRLEFHPVFRFFKGNNITVAHIQRLNQKIFSHGAPLFHLFGQYTFADMNVSMEKPAVIKKKMCTKRLVK